jgi:hypothetical protein
MRQHGLIRPYRLCNRVGLTDGAFGGNICGAFEQLHHGLQVAEQAHCFRDSSAPATERASRTPVRPEHETPCASVVRGQCSYPGPAPAVELRL